MMGLSRFFAVIAFGWSMVGLMALLAHAARRLTTAHMQADGVSVGINFENHGSTWWLLAVLVSLVALLVSLYYVQWPMSWQGWWPKIALAFVITVAMHLSWTLAPYPDFMVARRWVPSLVAYPHMVIMWGVITVLLMTYLETPGMHPPVAAFTAMYTTWHVFVGNHMLQKGASVPPPGFPPYEFWDAGPITIICLVAAIMTGATVYALR